MTSNRNPERWMDQWTNGNKTENTVIVQALRLPGLHRVLPIWCGKQRLLGAVEDRTHDLQTHEIDNADSTRLQAARLKMAQSSKMQNWSDRCLRVPALSICL